MKVTSTTDITRPSTSISIEPVVSRGTYINIRTYYIFPVFFVFAHYVLDMFDCLLF